MCSHYTIKNFNSSIRVSNQQKKLEIDIPKLEDFIHNVYINFARKLYANIYLFEKDIMPLSYQKNMREAELLCRECILKVMRDSMPIEQILRAYMDETIYDEIIEETLEKQVTEDEAIDMLEEAKKNNENSDKNKDIEINKMDTVDKDHEISVEEPTLLTNNEIADNAIKEATASIKNEVAPEVAAAVAATTPAPAVAATTPAPAVAATTPAPAVAATAPIVAPALSAPAVLVKPEPETPTVTPTVSPVLRPKSPIMSPKTNISFSDDDHILDMGTNKKSVIHAPKTTERLAEISRLANIKRKQEDDDDDDDFDDDFNDDGPLKISGDNITLDISDIQNISQDFKINKNPILDDIEVLA